MAAVETIMPITNRDVVQAVEKRRQETGGAIGPSLRELEKTLGLAYSAIQPRVQALIRAGMLSCVWVEHAGQQRVMPGSLNVTEAGLAALEAQGGD
jgi:hypothetical protein